MIRITTAAPLPQITACRCCLGGSERAASAMTTALSPDRTMLTPMICISATQNSGSFKDMVSSPFRETAPPAARPAGAIDAQRYRTRISFDERLFALLAQHRRQHDQQARRPPPPPSPPPPARAPR